MPSFRKYCQIFTIGFALPYLCLWATLAVAVIRNVPGVYTTIQAGIDAAETGDTVLVADGTYTGSGNRDIDFNGKAITVQSVNGSTSTTIDCQGSGRGFHFHNSEGAGSGLTGFTITNGQAGNGGGILLDSASPTISECRLIGNTADFYGGGIFCDNVSSPEIAECTFTDNSANFGGGIACRSSSPPISGCNLDTNIADYYGGGIYCDTASPEVTGSTFNANMALRYGGGIYCESSSSPNITECIISNNSAPGNSSGAYGKGGGIYTTNSSPQIAGSNLNGNTALSSGGAVYSDDSDLSIDTCHIIENTSGGNGGGIFCLFNAPSISNSLITDNSADFGGGIYLESCSQTADDISVIENAVVTGNTATSGGGGMNIVSSYALIANSVISYNTAEFGGGIRCRNALSPPSFFSPAFLNCIFSNNNADYGGAIDISSARPTFTNCTVTKNTAANEGGGVRHYSSSTAVPMITNTILWENAPGEIKVVSGPIVFEYCDIQGGFIGTGNIDSDPRFLDAANSDFHLNAESPCIDAATSNNALNFDIEYTARWDDPDTPNTGAGTDPYYDIGALEYYPVCEGDLDRDRDVDGFDLYSYVSGTSSVTLDAFAGNFGSHDCP